MNVRFYFYSAVEIHKIVHLIQATLSYHLYFFSDYYLKKKKFILYILACVWGHTVLITSLPLFGWSRYVPEAFGTSCTIDWVDNSPKGLAYNIVVLVTCYCVHVIILVYCYYHIIKGFSLAAAGIRRLRDEVIVDNQTLKLEMMLRYHKTMTYRKVTVVSS